MVDNQGGSTIEGDAPAATSGTATIDRRELALVAVERTRMPMVITDPRQPDNPIVLANQAFLDLTGYTAEEVIGRNCRFLQGPETDPAAIEKIRRELHDHQNHLTVELLNYRKDGTSFWNQLAINPVFDEQGELAYYFASQEDLTAERRVERLERNEPRLLKEIDHRAINALALVQSILRLTRARTVDSFSAQVGARVDALARAHRLLASSGWSSADLLDVIAIEVPPEVRERVKTQGPSTSVNPQYVQPLALVFHELMANAREHGALASPAGSVGIEWVVRKGALDLRWNEHGGHRPDAAATRGVGLSMVQGTVERQLGGRYDMSWPPEGMKLAIRLPYDSIVTSPDTRI